ncbi:kelch-like protein, partial [Corallococcus coralloides]|nr:kelch-like protein [Corallococcus coralloides]
GRGTGSLSIHVGPPTTARFPPEVVETFQSVTTVPAAGGTVVFRVSARDPQGSALGFSWTANVGTLSVATSDSTTSEVVWTPPACVPAGTSPSITATVANTLGGSVSTSFSLAAAVACPPPSICGDGVMSGPEACDDGNTATESACPNGQTSCTTCNSTCTTVFHSLGVARAGTSAGSISSAPFGINCPTGSCTALFAMGTPVTLTATAAAGSTFTGWSGAGCGGTGDCLVTMTAAASVTASFSLPSRPVIISASQSATTVPASGGVTFVLTASDPQSSALSYSWTASVGTLGVPSNGSTQSAVMWTPPACVVSGNTASITATVTNAFNLTTVTGFTVSGLSLCEGWAATGAMTSPRSFHTATLLKNGMVLVAGGRSAASGSFLSTAEVYDPVSGTWSATGPMASIRELHSATLLPSGKVLVAGGYNGAGRAATAEVYDPDSGTWSSTSSMASNRSNHTATLLNSGKVLVAGGYGPSSYNVATAELYDPASGTWSATGSMAAPRRDHKAALLTDGRVLVTGGWNGSGGIHATAELYYPASGGGWGAAGVMALPRVAHTMTLLTDGKVLVSGGYGNGSYHAKAEVYGPWSAAGSMSRSCASHTATLLKNGRVLVAGGERGGTSLATAHVFDPVSGIWSETGSMASPRRGHTETLLPNGKVLIAGGFNSEGYLAAAELYTP